MPQWPLPKFLGSAFWIATKREFHLVTTYRPIFPASINTPTSLGDCFARLRRLNKSTYINLLMCTMHRTWRIPFFSYVVVFNANWTLLVLSPTNEITITPSFEFRLLQTSRVFWSLNPFRFRNHLASLKITLERSWTIKQNGDCEIRTRILCWSTIQIWTFALILIIYIVNQLIHIAVFNQNCSLGSKNLLCLRCTSLFYYIIYIVLCRWDACKSHRYS